MLEKLPKQLHQYLRLTYSLYKQDCLTIDTVTSTIDDIVVLNYDVDNYCETTSVIQKELEENYNRATDWRIIEEQLQDFCQLIPITVHLLLMVFMVSMCVRVLFCLILLIVQKNDFLKANIIQLYVNIVVLNF